MLLMLPGIVKLVKPVQFLKEQTPILVTLLGIVIFIRL